MEKEIIQFVILLFQTISVAIIVGLSRKPKSRLNSFIIFGLELNIVIGLWVIILL